jgi:cytochrome c peroxidase
VMFGLGDRPGYAETLDQMKAHYRRPPPTAPENRALAALGRELFFDPIISASGRTACATCHRPELGFAANEPDRLGAPDGTQDPDAARHRARASALRLGRPACHARSASGIRDRRGFDVDVRDPARGEGR